MLSLPLNFYRTKIYSDTDWFLKLSRRYSYRQCTKFVEEKEETMNLVLVVHGHYHACLTDAEHEGKVVKELS